MASLFDGKGKTDSSEPEESGKGPNVKEEKYMQAERGKGQTPEKRIRENIRFVPADAAGMLLFFLAAAMAVCSLSLCTSTDIWYDELFTMGFIGEPVERLLELAAKDVHPPLYYLIVKAFVDTVHLFASSIDPVVIAKTVSVLPYLCLLAYAAWLVRKRDGWLCAGLFAFCLLSMPQMSNYTTEIRMYGWALFFLTAAFLHVREILITRRAVHWAAFFVYGICAAYCHYFAAVSVVFLYLVLAVLLLWEKAKNERQEKADSHPAGKTSWLKTLKPCFWCAGLSVLSYLPWLPAALDQVSAVREDYWILPLTLSCFGGCVKFVLKPSTGWQVPDYVIAVLLFVCLFVYLIRAFFCRKKAREEWEKAVYASCGIWVLAGTALFGIAVSFLMRPVFVYRYMLPALGGFWFCFAYFAAEGWSVPGGCQQGRRQGRRMLFSPVSRKRLWKLLLLLLLLLVGLVDYRSFLQGELVKKEQMERTLQAFEGMEEDSIVLFNFDQVQAVASYYLNRETWLYGDEPEMLIKEMFPDVQAGGDALWVRSLLEEGRTVWFVGSNLAREAVLAEWAEYGMIPVETVDSLLLERYWFNLYRMSLEA